MHADCCRLLVDQALSSGGQRATVALMEMPVSNAFAERDRQGISFQAGPPANLEIS